MNRADGRALTAALARWFDDTEELQDRWRTVVGTELKRLMAVCGRWKRLPRGDSGRGARAAMEAEARRLVVEEAEAGSLGVVAAGESAATRRQRELLGSPRARRVPRVL